MLSKYPKPLVLNDIELDYKKETFVMGILNVTPDSFSDGGKFNSVERAVQHAKEMVENGAKIIDIGGESTRPGYTRISDEEEIARVVPVIKALLKEVPAILSIDTYKSAVARAAIEAGAHMINDIWGAKADPEIAKVAAEYNVPIILMHNRKGKSYNNYYEDYLDDLQQSINIVKEAGVPESHIIVDPGIGFVKNLQQSVETMQRLEELVAIGYPVLLATSRKRMIGTILNLPLEERVEGTAATCAYGVMKGCHIVRVHDVKEVSRTVKMIDALMGKFEVNEELPARH
ncbi:dihydropteroate synthase [Ureibacillus chungkukjangi]|uniref:Dihydropteroate synthase n=1 Tax=Ureibacillus chungkukjangi TaxID=1202712 RepID=A0A318TLD7_9BACL|nr:dihydropteroate synthase [Ureibacillus chungkukjangi]MCM3389806.1 dihydropteroate synthase [Ureibacillus chungkukjangi]PYF04660.1 dihydropteroate synthase [Ureibacillus chungkukjangi]HCG4536055.1 dihydropteroate synthase [Salmonella enterica subsp. enterica serovar Typhi str. AG3]